MNGGPLAHTHKQVLVHALDGECSRNNYASHQAKLADHGKMDHVHVHLCFVLDKYLLTRAVNFLIASCNSENNRSAEHMLELESTTLLTKPDHQHYYNKIYNLTAAQYYTSRCITRTLNGKSLVGTAQRHDFQQVNSQHTYALAHRFSTCKI